MTCEEADLELVDKPPPLERSSHQPMPETTRNYSRERKSIESVDLHGFNVRDAIDRVTDAVDKAILLGLEQIEVIHGYGSGKVRDGVHEHLKTLSVVKSFKIDEFNSGKTRVYL
jgi:DNA mismatch repair protein MutS2